MDETATEEAVAPEESSSSSISAQHETSSNTEIATQLLTQQTSAMQSQWTQFVETVEHSNVQQEKRISNLLSKMNRLKFFQTQYTTLQTQCTQFGTQFFQTVFKTISEQQETHWSHIQQKLLGVENQWKQCATKMQTQTQQLIKYKTDLQEKNNEFEAYKTKVEDWKSKVKELTKKDTQTIEKLKKLVKEKEEAAAAQKKKIPSNFSILDKLDYLQQIWILIEYEQNEEKVKEWKTYQELDQLFPERKDDLQQSCPTFLNAKLVEPSEQKWKEEQTRLEAESKEWKRQFDEKEEELKSYKTRAHAALKKKTESVNTIKDEYDKKLGDVSKEKEELQEQIKNLQQKVQDLENQSASMIESQIKLVQVSGEMDLLQKENEENKDRIKDLEQHLENLTNQFETEKKKLIDAHSEEVKQMEEKWKETEEQLRKENNSIKERNRKMLDDKEREIAKLQKKISSLKTMEASPSMPHISSTTSISSSSEPIEPTNSQQTPLSLETPKKVVIDLSKSNAEQEASILRSVLHDTAATTTNTTTSNTFESIPLSPLKTEQTNGNYAILRSPLSSASTSAQQDFTLEVSDFDRFVKMAESQASKDSEIQFYKSTITKLKSDLEQKERNEENYKETERRLRIEMETLEKNAKGANLEYLKNIMLKSFEVQDVNIKSKLHGVIATILNMDKTEQDKMTKAFAKK